jgi:Trypsin-like peptidase domain
MFFMLVVCCVAVCHAQVTSNVFTRVLELKSGGQLGTGFTVDVDGRQYLITAKHLVTQIKERGTVDVFAANQWMKIDVRVFRCADPVDVAVLVPDRVLTPSYALEAVSNTHSFIVGQDAYFLGFPYGIAMAQWSSLNLEHPLAFTAKASISAAVHEGDAEVLLLDGRNNPGFSGAPVVFRDVLQEKPTFYLAGVVSGFRPELVPVTEPEVVTSAKQLKGVEAWRIRKRKDGKTVVLRDTERMVPQNTGIVIAYHIKAAMELIAQHPIGPAVAQ